MMNRIRMEMMSLPRNEALARSVAAAFIAPLDPTIEELADVRTAVSEAVTNAVVHGYRLGSGVIIMECSIEGNTFTVSVEDRGCGIEDIPLAMEPFYTTGPEGERTGMGFAVMKAFMDSVKVESEIGRGTKVIMEKRFGNGDGSRAEG